MRLLAVTLLAACSFQGKGVGATGGDAPLAIDVPVAVIDAVPGDAFCTSTCTGTNTLDVCGTGVPETCTLGCATLANGTGMCRQPTPSNGVPVSDLDGVDNDLVIAANATLDSDTGRIAVDIGGAILRTPGLGLSPEGLRFATVGAGIGVLGVRNLIVQAGARLRVTGNAPLVLLAAGDMTINGGVEASADGTCSQPVRAMCPGAGGGVGGTGGMAPTDGGGCAGGHAGTFDNGALPEIGGGGGGFGSPGGGDAGDATATAGKGGAANCSQVPLVPLVGGSGGGGGGGDSGSAGGGGGGALQLTALGNIIVMTIGEIPANVAANGAGGQAGGNGDGGGGGGSGGGLILEGQNVTIMNAILAANAGGGGAGNNGTDGMNGTLTTMGAPGGTGGRPGGTGAAHDNAPSNGTGGGDGTGGGGGAIGRIVIHTGPGGYTKPGATVSPSETQSDAVPLPL